MVNDVPVLVPAFRRRESLAVVLEGLTRATNSRIPTRIVVAHDGPKSPDDFSNRDCREYLAGVALDGVDVLARERNLGLSVNIRSAVDQLTAEHGAVIVVEDDLAISPHFYDYMVHQLDRHASDDELFSVSGYSFARWGTGKFRTYRLPMISSWGWATWDASWKQSNRRHAADMLERLSTGEERDLGRRFDVGGSYPYSELLAAWDRGDVDSWAIEWYASQFALGGQSVFPSRCLCVHQRVGEATNRDVPPLAEQRLFTSSSPNTGRAPYSSHHAAVVRASLRARKIPKPLNLASWMSARIRR
jgi:hypothetical protein